MKTVLAMWEKLNFGLTRNHRALGAGQGMGTQAGTTLQPAAPRALKVHREPSCSPERSYWKQSSLLLAQGAAFTEKQERFSAQLQ